MNWAVQRIRREGYVVFLLLFFSCSSSKGPWILENTTARYPPHSSGRLCLPSDDLFLQVGMELVRNFRETRLYIYTTGKPFPVMSEDSSKTEITLTIDGSSRKFAANCFEGRQKLLVPERIKEELVRALLTGHSCSFTIGPHHREVPQRNFKKLWSSLTYSP